MRKAKYTEEMILEAARRVKAKGKTLTPWAVRVELGGGKVDRIEQVILDPENELLVIEAEPVVEQQLLSLPTQFSSQVEQIQQAMHTTACEMWRTASEMADNRVKDELVAARKAKEAAEYELSEAREVVDRQEDELEKIEESLEAEREKSLRLESELNEQKAGNRQLTKQNEGLEEKVSELTDQVEQLAMALSEMEKEKALLERDRDNATEALNSNKSRHEAAISVLKDEHQSVVEKMEKLHEKNSEALIKAHDKATDELKAANSKTLETLQNSLSDVQKQRDDFRDRIPSLEKKSGALESERDGLKNTVSKLTDELKTLDAKYKQLSGEKE